MIADVYEKDSVSAYQPSDDVKELTKHAKKDYEIGWSILHRPAEELNYYSVIDRMNKDQRTFNALVDESSEDPREAWKWRGTRSTARKKTMAMHAHLTAEYIIPLYSPDDTSQKVDAEVGGVMRDGVRWMTIHSNYQPAFLLGTQGMLVNPVTYLSADYCEVYQTIKERTDSGYATTEVLDEVLSGFNARVHSADEILITNEYLQEIQRQRCIIKRRYIEFTEAEAKYGEHANWQYVRPGIKSVFNEDDGLFYDVKDDEHATLVEEAIHLCRREDCEDPYVNGIYMGNENVEWNPIKHRDNQNAPRYNFVPFGYQRINEHYFYFKSLVNLVGWDDQLIDAMYEVQMNREFLDLEPPTFYSGFDKIDTDVIWPGATIANSDADAKVSPILPPSRGNGYKAIELAEKSASDESINETEMGQLPEASQKAFTVAQASQNAKIILSGARKSLGQSVVELGYLMGDIFINHFTTAQIDEISGNLKYRQFVLEDQIVNGRKVSKRIRFDESLMERNMSEPERKEYTMKLLNEVGYPDHKEELIVLNPHLFSKMKYLVRVDPDTMEPKNREFAKVLVERLYSLTRQDPNANPVALLRKLYAEYYPNEVDELMAKNPQDIMGQMFGAQPMQQTTGAKPTPKLSGLTVPQNALTA